MDKCVVCGGEEFYIEAGFYFCKECQTQQQVKIANILQFLTCYNPQSQSFTRENEKKSSNLDLISRHVLRKLEYKNKNLTLEQMIQMVCF